MARGPICSHCDEKLALKQVFCGKCGHPTEHANHDERVLWDLGQWEVSRRRDASDDPKVAGKASQAAARTKDLFRTAQDKAANAVELTRGSEKPVAAPQAPKRFLMGRIRREPASPPAAVKPAASKPAPAPPGPSAPQSVARSRPAAPAPSAPPPPAARPNGTARAETPRSAPPPSPPSRTSSSQKIAARSAPTITPERPPSAVTQETTRRAAPTVAPTDAPLIMIRKTSAEAEASAAPAAAPPAPAQPSQTDRRAREEQGREAERLRKQEQKDAERLREEQRKESDRRKAEQKKAEERRRNEEAKGARKRERKHRRHSKRVNRRAAELDLRDGERVSLSIMGWSRFRRATLVVTNFRVALITRMPAQVRWIPLEEVDGVHHRWFGAHSLVVTSPIEVLTLQKGKRQMLASFQQLLESEVAEARKPAATERHHADITQEWCDRSTEIWDSNFGRLQLRIRRHPVRTAAMLAAFVVAAYVVSSIMNRL